MKTGWRAILVATGAHALSLNMCASANTGGGSSVSDIYMSNGFCLNHCQGYAFGVVQGQDCWCTNEAPGSTTDVGSCDMDCPGYPDEKCGGDGLFGYIKIPGGRPSGTQQESSKAPESTIEPESEHHDTPSPAKSDPVKVSVSVVPTVEVVTSIVEQVVTATPSPVTTTKETTETTTSRSTSSSTVSSTQTSESSSAEPSPKHSSLRPTTIVSVKTVNGKPSAVVSTQFVTASPTPSPTPSEAPPEPSESAKPQNKGFFDSTGKVAGTFTAVGVVVVALCSLLLWCCCCAGARKSTDDEAYTEEESVVSVNDEKAAPPTVSDTPSTAAPAYTKHARQNSVSAGLLNMFGGSPSDNVNRSSSRKKLVDPAGDDDIIAPPLTQFDHRLDPSTMFLGPNFSEKSLDDDVDYSRRVLRVANPDSNS
ncbi:hypothetical protein DICA3_F19922 [Diutina catenulata]